MTQQLDPNLNPDVKDELIGKLRADIDALRRTCMMVREELEFGGDWKTARLKIDTVLRQTGSPSEKVSA
jgi:hypothetical protein